MKIVVTGALGHIGSRLVRDLPRKFPAAQIVMLDNLATQRYASLFNLPPEGNYRFIEADVLEVDLESLVQGAAAVVHLAAITDAMASHQNPDMVRRVNLGGTRRLAEACSGAAVPLLFPSSTSVYGVQQGVVDEDCPARQLSPQSPYAETKLEEEAILAERAAAGDLRYVICRLGTIVGTSPGMRFHTAVNKFCWQAVMGTPLSVWRSATHQMRPYLDLNDAIRAIAFTIQRELFDNRVYNVLTANRTVDDIVQIIRNHVPDLTVKLVDTEIMSQLSYEVCCQRLKSQGFEFRGNLEHGIAETISLLQQSHTRGP